MLQHRALPFLLLAVAVFACYGPAIFAGFVYDDHFQLVANPYTKDFATLKVLFTENVWTFGSGSQSVYFRPFHMLAYLLVYQLFGLSPVAYHLTNILIHLAVVLLFRLVLLHFTNPVSAFLGSLLFAVHPVQVEPVAWIAGTPDVMYSGFVLLSFLLYLRGDVWLSLVPFACGVLSKEPAVLLPALVILDHWLFRRWEKQKIQRWILGACLILFVYFGLRWNAIGPVWKLAREVPMGLFEQIISGAAFAGLYVLKFLFPSELNVYYDYSLPLPWQVLATGCATFICILIMAYLCRKQRSVLFGLGWFLLFLIPALILRAVSASLFAERYLYLSSAGLLLACFSFPLRKRITVAVLCLAVVLSWISFERARIWKDDQTLWTDSVEKSPNVSAVTYNLATAYVHQKRWEEAAVWFARTIELKKDMPAAYFNLAICSYNLGDREAAKKNLEIFLQQWKGSERMRNDALQKLKKLQHL